MNNNIYKYFRGVEALANPFKLNKRFDEPTYLSFRLIFGDDQEYNKTGYNVSNDVMPHPLFMTDEYNVASSSIANYANTTENITQYSAVRYLIDANEPTRAKMLAEFINKFKYLQTEFSYYFQSIDGVSELIKVDPTKGVRILPDKKLVVTCLEGLDQRMTYLMNLYRKIVWDDVYQRWVLPDMMRYFTLKIYLSEFRTFHMTGVDGWGFPSVQPATNNLNLVPNQASPQQLVKSYNAPITTKAMQNSQFKYPSYLTLLNDILPVWVITCEMCEFDITDVTYDHLTNLSVANDPTQGAVKFGIKVGNIKELQMYPVFEHMFLSDKKINGLARLKDEISTTTGNRSEYTLSLLKAQSRETTESTGHISGMPYLEHTNQNTVKDAQYPSTAVTTNSEATANEVPMFNPLSGNTTSRPIDSTLPNTWVGNALDFGTSYAKNFVKKIVDKGKTMEIPGLGASFTEIQAAIQSKDIVTAFGMIRKAVDTVKNDYVFPSERLSNTLAKETGGFEKAKASQDLGAQITDTIMMQLIHTLSKSEATDETSVKLQEASNMVLSDKGLWEKIKDFSLATNMIGIGEENMGNEILNKSDYANINAKESASRLSGTPESGMKQNVVASAATSGKLQGEKMISGTTVTNRTLQIGEVIESVPTSKATNSVLEKQNLETALGSRATENKLQQ